jgi:hypothetical protein
LIFCGSLTQVMSFLAVVAAEDIIKRWRTDERTRSATLTLDLMAADA